MYKTTLPLPLHPRVSISGIKQLLTCFCRPDDSNVMPLAVGDGNVGGELEEDGRVLGIILEQVDVHARVDGLKQHATVCGVIFRTEKGD